MDIKNRKNKLNNNTIEIAMEVKKRIGQELHNTLLQELTLITYLLKSLEISMSDKSYPEIEEVYELKEVLNKTIGHAREFYNDMYTEKWIKE